MVSQIVWIFELLQIVLDHLRSVSIVCGCFEYFV